MKLKHSPPSILFLRYHSIDYMCFRPQFQTKNQYKVIIFIFQSTFLCLQLCFQQSLVITQTRNVGFRPHRSYNLWIFHYETAHKNFIEEVKTNKEGLTGKDSINMKFVGIVADQRQSWFNQIFQTSELYRQLVKISCTNSIYSTTMAIARA